MKIVEKKVSAGNLDILPFDPAVARTIFKKYFGPNEDRWDPRFREDIEGDWIYFL
jgi:hypothetical protein